MSTMIENMRRSNSNLIADRLLSVVPDRWHDALQGKLEQVLAESQNDERAGAAFVREKVAEYSALPGETYTVESYDHFLLVAGLGNVAEAPEDSDDELLEIDLSSDREFARAAAALEAWRAQKDGKQIQESRPAAGRFDESATAADDEPALTGTFRRHADRLAGNFTTEELMPPRPGEQRMLNESAGEPPFGRIVRA